MPESWRIGLRFVHEVWAPSRFSADGARSGCCPTSAWCRTRWPRSRRRPSRLRRADFGLPDAAVVTLVAFNLASSYERKNPLAAIAAHRLAFGDRPDRILLLRVGNPHHFPADFAAPARRRRGPERPHRDRHAPARRRARADGRRCDIVLSLHRSEGFGLVPAEAMLLGKPVIATDWSGNCDFMDASCAAMVPARLIPARDPRGVFEAPGAVWADPDIAVAADWLARLADDPAERARLRPGGPGGRADPARSRRRLRKRSGRSGCRHEGAGLAVGAARRRAALRRRAGASVQSGRRARRRCSACPTTAELLALPDRPALRPAGPHLCERAGLRRTRAVRRRCSCRGLARWLRARTGGRRALRHAGADGFRAGARRCAGPAMPYAVVVHDADSHPGDRFPMQIRLQRYLLRGASAVFALSTHVADRLRQQGLVEGKKPLLIASLPPLDLRPGPAAAARAWRQAAAAQLRALAALQGAGPAGRQPGPARRHDGGFEVRVVGSGPESAGARPAARAAGRDGGEPLGAGGRDQRAAGVGRRAGAVAPRGQPERRRGHRARRTALGGGDAGRRARGAVAAARSWLCYATRCRRASPPRFATLLDASPRAAAIRGRPARGVGRGRTQHAGRLAADQRGTARVATPAE